MTLRLLAIFSWWFLARTGYDFFGTGIIHRGHYDYQIFDLGEGRDRGHCFIWSDTRTGTDDKHLTRAGTKVYIHTLVT